MPGSLRAPEIDLPGLAWFNVRAPLSLGALRGKLVLLDFWTFCCINCMQILPSLRRVEERFPEDLAVIGVHSPKFAAERDPAKVEAAIARYDIRHPVVHDPEFQIWQRYAIRAWPTLVFIAPDGSILGAHSGEPDPDRLVEAVAGLIAQGKAEGRIRAAPLDLALSAPPGGRLAFPGKIKPLGPERLALADSGHHQILVLSASGEEEVRIGSGEAGHRDGDLESAAFNAPQGLIGLGDQIYVADTGNHALRRVDLAAGKVTTLSQHGRRGGALGPDERVAAETALASPWDLESDGKSLFIANAGTHQLLRLDLASGRIAGLAGDGGEAIEDGPAMEARLAQPSGLALSPDHRALYFADSETSSIRRLDLGPEPRVQTLVGTGLFDFGQRDGTFAEALLQHPLGLCWHQGELLVADSYNGALRRLDLAAGEVTEFDGGRFLCEDSLCLPLAEPAGICAIAGAILVSDTNNHRVLRYDPAAARYRTWFA